MTVHARARWVAFLAALGGIVVLVLGVAPCSARAAAEPEVKVATTTPQVEDPADESEEGQQVTLPFVNASDAAVQLTLELAPDATCEPELDPATLAPETITRVVVHFPEACGSAAGTPIELVPDPAKGTVLPFVITPQGATAEAPNWANLLAFVYAFGAAVIGAFFLFLFWKPPTGAVGGFRQPLLHVDAAWKLDENWGTNIVALAAPLGALFTATVAKPILGEDAESVLALAAVAGAAASAIVLLAPVALVACSSFGLDPVTKERHNSYTVGGVLLAGILVMSGAYGLLWVFFKTTSRFDMGGIEHRVWIPFVLVGLLFLAYAYRSTKAILDGGADASAVPADPQPKAPPTLDHSWSLQLGKLLLKVTHSEPVPVAAPSPGAARTPPAGSAPPPTAPPARAAVTVAAAQGILPLTAVLPESAVRSRKGLTSGLL